MMAHGGEKVCNRRYYEAEKIGQVTAVTPPGLECAKITTEMR
jgi:hypothetical protein